MKRLSLLLIMLLLVAGFFYFGLDQQLSLAGAQDRLTELTAWREARPVTAGLIYLLSYIAVTSLSLPGAAVLTLAGGALFGLFWGTLLVSFASSIGATLAFLAARYMLRGSVERRFGDRLKSINEGIAREGAFYLFALRLVPLFPFFLINLLMGLTSLKVKTFYWVSQLGMLAGTVVYVNAGRQLAAVDSLAGIFSPALLGAFLLLGTFPLIARKLLALLSARRVYHPYRPPKKFDRNLIVIGAGAAGLVSAYIAAAVKAKVTLVEAHKMGGDCLNYGCVPSKALIKSASVAHTLRHASRYGLEDVAPRISFPRLMKRVQEVVAAIEPHDSVARYTGLGVDVVQGHARLLDPWTVEISRPNDNPLTLTARSIVLATGAGPYVPSLPGLEALGYVTSDTLWEAFSHLEHPPERLLVLGGGPIGCELAQSFARLGSQVTLVEMAPRLLIREDEEVSEFVRSALESDGVRILLGHKALRGEPGMKGEAGHKFLVVEHAGAEQYLAFDELLCAVGRVARLSGFGLEPLGIATEGKLVTNAYLETLYPNIYAAGDVVGAYQFTHTASHQAWYAVVNALFGGLIKFKVDYRVIPWTTFTDPEVARVGLNEQEANAQGIAYERVRYELDDLDRAITEGQTRGFVMVLTEPGRDRILGATIVGAHAGELLAEFVLAMKHGLGLNKIMATIHSYPTWSEANKYAAGEWKRAHAPQRALAWLARYHRWRRGGLD
jgi:pyruvate/2-oxoglutarate dehydrogenase complex dihydrolipoamide dehydrogenase (E3) component/uncharacterized membrane protein YdjX (TVP38/TMEM64 family)